MLFVRCFFFGGNKLEEMSPPPPPNLNFLDFLVTTLMVSSRFITLVVSSRFISDALYTPAKMMCQIFL